MKVGARKVFHGKVAALTPGAINAEVEVALAGGAEVAAIVTKETVGEPCLKPGMPATALIKASHVILGVPS